MEATSSTGKLTKKNYIIILKYYLNAERTSVGLGTTWKGLA